MVQWHYRDDKKVSGGKRNTVGSRTKKLAWKGGTAALTKTATSVKKDNIEVNKGLGNTKKSRALSLKNANVTDGKGKIAKYEIIAVKTNNANRLFARANVSTKGAIIKVKVGEAEKFAKVTNRPGQEGVVNAIFVEMKE
ncbi:MAG: 30S ribosomal protein S8e [archaeon]|jgi:small subunit ribosomal protein S8e